VRMRDGGVQRSVWSREKIDAHKEQYSQAWRRAEKGKRDSFWHTAWPAAAKKTVIRDMIARGLLPVSAEYREAVDRGLRHDDEGERVDWLPGSAEEMTGLPGPESEEEIDRPQTASEVNQDLIDLARQDFADATDADGVERSLAELAKHEQCNEPTRTALEGMAADRKNAIAEFEAKPKKGQKALV
jgi:recombinational DNA repair protein RecT